MTFVITYSQLKLQSTCYVICMPNTCTCPEFPIAENKKNFIYNELGIDTQILQQSYKTMVIRHPFERILSSYLYFFHKTKGEQFSRSGKGILQLDITKKIEEEIPKGLTNLIFLHNKVPIEPL